MQVKLRPKYTYPVSQVVFIMGQKRFSNLRIPYLPIFQVSQQITLKEDPALLAALGILSGQIVKIPSADSQAVIDKAKMFLGVSLTADTEELAMEIISKISGSNNIQTQIPQELAKLPARQVIKTVDYLLQIADSDMDQKIDAAMKKVQTTQVVQKAYEAKREAIKTAKKYKQYESKVRFEADEEEDKRPRRRSEKNQQGQQKGGRRQKGQGYYREEASDWEGGNPKRYKLRTDERIKLGITGDSVAGWRERLRPIPATSNVPTTVN